MIPPFPLAWPEGLPRTERKATSQFRTQLSSALRNVEKSLAAFGADSGRKVTDVSISSNVTLGQARPADPGIAVWFEWDGQQRCIAVDRYPKPEDNLQAVHHILEARRTEMRHGGLHVVRQTFKGFIALPAPDSGRDWRTVLGFYPGEPATSEKIEKAYRRLAAEKHPDKGGNHEEMSELNTARKVALDAIKETEFG